MVLRQSPGSMRIAVCSSAASRTKDPRKVKRSTMLCCTAVQVADPSLTLLMIYVTWPAKECSLGWGGFQMSDGCTQR